MEEKQIDYPAAYVVNDISVGRKPNGIVLKQ